MSSNVFTDLLGQFATLSLQDRRAFLTQLSTLFHPSDWWFMHDLLKENSTYDILGFLPTEIAILVIRHIDPVELVRLRRVSKRWQMLLTSEPICSESARTWFPGDVQVERAQYEATREGTSCKKWREILENSASRKHFFTNGHPTGNWLLQPSTSMVNWSKTFRKGILAWVCHDRESFCVQRLNTEEFLFHNQKTPQREQVTRIILLERHVVVITQPGNRFYVWNIETKKHTTSRLPSARINTVKSDDEFVFFIANWHIIVYDADTNSSTLVPCFKDYTSDDESEQPHFFLANAQAKSLSHCLTFLDPKGNASVRIKTYSTVSGDLIARYDQNCFEWNSERPVNWRILNCFGQFGEQKYPLAGTAWPVSVDSDKRKAVAYDLLILCYDGKKGLPYKYELRVYGVSAFSVLWIWKDVVFMYLYQPFVLKTLWTASLPSSAAIADFSMSRQTPYVIEAKKVVTGPLSRIMNIGLFEGPDAGPGYMVTSKYGDELQRGEILEFKGIHET